jgi:hypothetical protein
MRDARRLSTRAAHPVYIAAMRISLPTYLVCALSLGAGSLGGCGGGGSSGSGGGGATSGQETAGETEGFDEGFDDSEPTVDHGTGSARELLGVNPPPTPWDSMSHADQEMYMVGYVLPIHAEMFREHDATRYARMECATCHGDDGAERGYEMPSRSLPPLPAEGTPAWNAAQQRNPRGWAFMTDHVLPTIRTQLGENDMTCFGCHPHAGG